MNQRVSFLILANLGLVACAESQPKNNAEVAAPLIIPPMPSVTASAPPRPIIPPPASTPTAMAPTEDDDDDAFGAGPSPGGTGKACRSNKDCTGYNQVCSMPTGRKVGHCQTMMIIRGRPLTVDGRSHLAEYMRRETEPVVTSDEVLSLHQAAREEHASIAAFARTIAELMALGAPTWLLAETQRAMGDEIRHTERTLDLLQRFTGERPELGPLPAAVAPLARSKADFFRDILRGGAIGETLAAEDAERRRLATNDGALRAYYDMIVVDESRHAALAIKTLRWLQTLRDMASNGSEIGNTGSASSEDVKPMRASSAARGSCNAAAMETARSTSSASTAKSTVIPRPRSSTRAERCD